MTLARPKRKAAGNKNYLDALPEPIEEITKPPNPTRSKKRMTKSSSPTKPGVPYNWQPPTSELDIFSNKLNLRGATVDMHQQVLTCPEQAPEPTFLTEEEELRHLASLMARVAGIQADFKPKKRLKLLFQLRKGDFIYMVSEPPGEPYYIGRIMGFQRKVKEERIEEKNGGTDLKKEDGINQGIKTEGVEKNAHGKDVDMDTDSVEKNADPNTMEVSNVTENGTINKDGNDSDKEDLSHIDAAKCVFEIQWFYRPRDILKHTSDLRLLFASMHSDTCPLSSFRGMVVVKHRLDVETYYVPPPGQSKYSSALEFYSLFPNCFYFDKLFDRYMIKFYDIVKTSTLLEYVDNAANHSQHYLLALNKRFEYVFMEALRTKQFVNNFQSTLSSHCDLCGEWCSSSDSVTCGTCDKHFHMLCLDPPLLKRPSRGFSWSCAACTKKHELEHRSKKILMLSHDNRTTNELELEEYREIEPDLERKLPETILPKYEKNAIEFLKNDAHISVDQRRLIEEWSLRYLGIHTRLEDAVDLDDRSPYPRACTNLGTRYQALNIPEYVDHPIVYYDVVADETNSKKKGPGGRKTKKKAVVENHKQLPVPPEYQDIPTKEYPLWLQPRPKGYIERGVDDGSGETCTLNWKSRPEDQADNFQKLDAYILSCLAIAHKLDMFPNSPNFMDAIVKFWMDCDGNADKAFERASTLTRETLREPTLNKEEVKRFEAGVKKNGSELYPTFKEVKTQPCAMVVRYYYLWKKTKRGRQIWGNFPGRKKKKGSKDMKIVAVDAYADSDDDLAYENDKIIAHNKLFRCKHCRTYESQAWFKITGYDGTTKYEDVQDDIDPDTVTALCQRCAKLWRRYAVYWEDPAEVERKNARGIGGYRRKIESELVTDAERIMKHAEADGGNLSYESNKKNCILSVVVLPEEKMAKKEYKTDRKERNKDDKKEKDKKEKDKKEKDKKEKEKEKEVPRLTSRQLSILTKQAQKNERSEKEQVPEKRRRTARKMETDVDPVTEKENVIDKTVKIERTDKVKVEKKAEKVKVEKVKTEKVKKPAKKAEKKTDKKLDKTDVTDKDANGKAKTKKRRPEPKTEDRKRQRRNQDVACLNPVLNPAYRSELPRIATSKIDTHEFPSCTRSVLEEIICGFKVRQLTNIAQGAPPCSVDLPFLAHERTCCVCLEHDDRAESVLEMLICGNCGVNVHASCAGITLLGKQRPIKQWLCDACINDICPSFSTAYTCCVCLAHELHHEMAILGLPNARPDYLVPVLDTGRWCHWLCALFCHENVCFRPMSTPSFVSKEIVNANNTRPMSIAVESVSTVFVNNCTSRCGICHVSNGAMLTCGLCDNADTYHITCAQDTPNFKVGFKVVLQKGKAGVFVGDKHGRLHPMLVCPKHDQRKSVLNIRALGRRSPSSDPKPLVHLFIDDLVRGATRLSGPQLRANNYVSMVEKFMEPPKPPPREAEKTVRLCSVCRILSSPKWWPNADGSVRCQSCFREERRDSENEGDLLEKQLNEPLDGHNYGVRDPNDHITRVYTPLRDAVAERSLITLNDLLT